jgi:crossover junction endodeoxyribonuclease RusA
MLSLSLPWPPSVNTYWRNVSKGRLSGRVLISEAGRKYRKDVSSLIGAFGMRKALSCELSVSIIAYPPDRRRRDLDNILKSLLDSCTHAGLWLDDSQISRLTISRSRMVHPGGQVSRYVAEIPVETDWRVALGDAA